MTFYVINVDTFFKIGITQDLKERLKAYRTHQPTGVVEVVFQHAHILGPEIEKHWHRYFDKKRVSGEWFALSREDVDKIKRDTPSLWPETRGVSVAVKRARPIDSLVSGDRRSWYRLTEGAVPPRENKTVLLRLGRKYGPARSYVVTGYRVGEDYFTSDGAKLELVLDWANLPSTVPIIPG